MLDPAESDERLVALARRGDEAAFAAIVERYRPLLLAQSRRIVGDGAQDAVQQTFISAWSALRRGCEVRDLRPWLFTIAHRAALQALREQGERSDELPESLAGGHSPAEHAERAARTRETLAAIAGLPEPERDALVSTSVQGRSGRDTAHALGVSEAAVRQLVFRARARVRATAHVCVPPLFVPRLVAWLSHRARRVTALGEGNLTSLGSPETIGTLGKITAAVAAGVLLAAPVAALHFVHDHGASNSAHLRGDGATRPAPTSVGVAATSRTRPRALRRSPDGGVPSSLMRRSGTTVVSAPQAVAARSPSLVAGPHGIVSGASPGRGHSVGSSGASGPNVETAPTPADEVVKQITAPSGQVPNGVAEQVLPAVTHAAQGAGPLATQLVQSAVGNAVQQTDNVVGEALPAQPSLVGVAPANPPQLP